MRRSAARRSTRWASRITPMFAARGTISCLKIRERSRRGAATRVGEGSALLRALPSPTRVAAPLFSVVAALKFSQVLERLINRADHGARNAASLVELRQQQQVVEIR